MPNHTRDHPFEGFSIPNGTQVPDIVFDELLPLLSGAELKVLMYVIRRTLGFRRDGDNISLSQMLNGIRKRDGTILDHGTGLSKKTLLGAINSLEERRYILTERRRSPEKGDEPTTYRLHLKGELPRRPAEEETTPPVGEKLLQGGGGETTPGPWRKNYPTQQAGLQATGKQQRYEHSHPQLVSGDLSTSKFERATPNKTEDQNEDDAGENTPRRRATRQAGFEPLGTMLQRSHVVQEYQRAAPRATSGEELSSEQRPAPVAGRVPKRNRTTRPRPGTDAAQAIRADLERYAVELGDEAPLSSTLTRVLHLYEQSELTIGGFLAQMNDAKRETLRRSGSIRKQRLSAGPGPLKNRTPYFLSLLTDYLGLKEQTPAQPLLLDADAQPHLGPRLAAREPRPVVSQRQRTTRFGPYVRVLPLRDDEPEDAAETGSSGP